MTDYTLEDTIYTTFTTRAFATGIPTTLGGTPVISAYENDNLTQITAGVTLGVDHDGLAGLNLVTIAATAANGFEAGKDYNLVITTGTVSGDSVVAETIGAFSIERSAAFTEVAGLNNIAATDIVSAGAITTLSGAVVNVDLVDTTTANTDMRGTDSALLAASAPSNWSSMVISVSGAVDGLVQGFLNTLLVESSTGRINDNFEFFYNNSDAQTTQTVDDVGGGGGGGTDWTASERNEIRGRLGITGTTAAGGNTPTLSLQSSTDAIKVTTDKFVFTIAGFVDCNILRVNDVIVTGTGASGDEWGP